MLEVYDSGPGRRSCGSDVDDVLAIKGVLSEPSRSLLSDECSG